MFAETTGSVTSSEITVSSTTYHLFTFSGAGTITFLPVNGGVEYLIIGGGGGGGTSGGGGGGGGYREGSTTINLGEEYAIVVGSGGATKKLE